MWRRACLGRSLSKCVVVFAHVSTGTCGTIGILEKGHALGSRRRKILLPKLQTFPLHREFVYSRKAFSWGTVSGLY